MTEIPRLSTFLPNGEVRTADVLAGAGKTIDAILNDAGVGDACDGSPNRYRGLNKSSIQGLRRLARQLRSLAAQIEQGK